MDREKVMTDREKVLKGLEMCASERIQCRDCPYRPDGVKCDKQLMTDAIRLIREQGGDSHGKDASLRA